MIMHLSIVLAIVGVASAAATGPNIWKRDFCADNCSGSFDANGGGDCANVEMCTNNCHACSAKSMDVRILFHPKKKSLPFLHDANLYSSFSSSPMYVPKTRGETESFH